ncbi:hypothetical protein HF086_018294 [Spodoptera exigua]|uniref:MEIS N-terminal domain-containing protein n=1 Tax=Spodoptera exigua TaxID=7107 RepID=A0A922M153_SPOEX|nr:hypothetical protein HF086_018294 [Spodoptera exigua]
MQGGGAPAADADQAQFEADKRAVYKHPLFPLLALLLERCEQATAGAEPPAAEAFGADLQAFVQHQRRDRRPFLVDDPEIDGLMIKSIQSPPAPLVPAPFPAVYPPHTDLPYAPAQRDTRGKKGKNGSSISKRYWPDALSNPQFTAG